MVATPISKLLRELEQAASGTNSVEQQVELSPCSHCRSEDEVRAELEGARKRGFAEGHEASRLEAIQAERCHADRLSKEQATHFDQLATDVLSSVAAGLERVRAEISGAVARSLTEFFGERIMHEAIEGLADELKLLLDTKPVSRLVVIGPQMWIDIVTPILQSAGAVDYELRLNDAIDVCIEVDQTRLETHVGAWIERLRSSS